MERKSCWAVSSGEYSDYGIIAVFSTKEGAEEYAHLHPGDGYDRVRVEEFPLDPIVVEPEPLWNVGWGWAWNHEKREWFRVWTANTDPLLAWRESEKKVGKVWKTSWSDGKVSYDVLLRADTKERALKAGTEKIMQFIAGE